MKKQNTRREFIKRGAQIAGAGLLTTGLLGCNVLLDETDGGGLSLRIGHTRLYWTNSSLFTINKSSINGAGSQTILDRSGVTGISTVNGIAVCPSIGKIYWTENDVIGAALTRSNLDGSGVENLFNSGGGSTDTFTGVAVDVPGGKVYWGGTSPAGVHRADLDGSNRVLQLGGITDQVTDVALDTNAGKMYYTDTTSNQIFQANLDGSGSTSIRSLGAYAPISIALDTDNGKMYWTDAITTGVLNRSNLDGSLAEIIVTISGGSIAGLTLDTQAGKVYWAQSISSVPSIRRANMDATATGKETLLTGTGFINRLDLG